MMNAGTGKRWIAAILIFLIGITGIRLLWLQALTAFEYPRKPEVVQGVADLRGWKFTDHQTLRLDGEWEFYPSALIDPDESADRDPFSGAEKSYVHVPGSWQTSFDEDDVYQYGTYRLRILTDQGTGNTFGLRIREAGNASAVYVNGNLLHEAGKPYEDRNQYEARRYTYTVTAPPGRDELEVVVQVASHTGDGGITLPVDFGTIDAIHLRHALSVGLQLLLCVALVIHCLYAFMLYFTGSSNSRSLLYFSLLIISAAYSVLVTDDRLLYAWFPLSYEWAVKTGYLSYAGTSTFLLLLINSLFPSLVRGSVLHGFVWPCGLYVLFVLIAPSRYVLYSEIVLSLLGLAAMSIGVRILVKARKHHEDAILLLLGCVAITASMIWPAVIKRLSYDYSHYPFDLIIALLVFSAFWFRRFFRTTDEAKQLNEKLQLEMTRKDEFLVNTSHELRNPLHSIFNLAQAILDDSSDTIRYRNKERLNLLQHVTQRMTLMLDDLIDVARLREQTVRLQLKPVYLQAVASGVLDMVRPMLEGKPVRLQADIDVAFPPVRADENRLIQVLFNLLHNAVKFTDEGAIVVRALKVGDQACIEVEDTGIGIEPSALSRIFNAYEQGDNLSGRGGGGFGLGLSISRQLIELHGGTLSAASTPGKGSVFRFTLPLSSEQELREEVPLLRTESGEVPGRGAGDEVAAAQAEVVLAETYGEFPVFEAAGGAAANILVVEDNQINRNILIELLESDGYTVTGAAGAEQALALLEKGRYDLIIADVMMPQTSGYALTQIVRERFTVSELPILLLTARARIEDILIGFQSGANDYVSKPVDARELKVRVRSLIQNKHSVEERLRLEGAWLQSQIQPHFLHNTINAIASLGVFDTSKMLRLLEEFGNYLRLSFDTKNTEPLVPLDRELTLVRSYLYIEKERFQERLDVRWDVEDGLNVLVPPLSIQPLVENAIRHGLMKRIQGGSVMIRIRKQDGQVQFTVKDNGRGMTREQAEQLLKNSGGTSHGTGVGLKNIDRRLRRQFGKGLSIVSVPDQGTTVTFEVPDIRPSFPSA